MIKLATLFSGIGAAEQALIKMNIEHEIVFACDNGEIELKETEEEIKEKIASLDCVEKNDYIKELYESTGKKKLYV